MKKPNPFRPTRYEREGKPLIWISPFCKALEERENFYVSGARGSGKTTLMKSLSTIERFENTSLADQIHNVDLSYIGIYIRWTEPLSNALGSIDWVRIAPQSADFDALEHDFFSKFLEANVGKEICQTLMILRSRSQLKYTVEEECAAVSEFLDNHEQLLRFASARRAPKDLGGLSKLFNNMQKEINISATRGFVGECIQKLPPSSPGDILDDLMGIIQTLYKRPKNKKPVALKLCFDDCEALSSNQQISINTLVRNTRNSIFWVICYVANYVNTQATFIPNQTLSEADRRLFDFQSQSDRDYLAFCEAVSSLRCYYEGLASNERPPDQLGSPASLFSLDGIVGRCPPNFLLDRLITKSKSKKFRDLSYEALEIVGLVSDEKYEPLAPAFDYYDGKVSHPPIYQAYIIRKLYPGLSIRSVLDKLLPDAERVGPTFRRKYVAALLCICKEFKIKSIPYSGKNAVLSLSNGCIRDYLEIMAHIFEAHARSRRSREIFQFMFQKYPMNPDDQSAALRLAGEEKHEGIRSDTEYDVENAYHLVEGIGLLMAKLHSEYRHGYSLHSAERGFCVVDLSKMKGRTRQEIHAKKERIKEVIAITVFSGNLQVVDAGSKKEADRPDTIKLKLHNRLAPHYGYSFRGGYGDFEVDPNDFFDLCSETKVDLGAWAEKCFEGIVGGPLDAQFEINLGYADD